MRYGRFEEYEDESGKIYRLRWSDAPLALPAPALTADETAHGRFIRYLIENGKISEFEAKTTPKRS